MKTNRLVLNALLIAMHTVLCFFSPNFGNMKLTLSGLPILIGSLLLGPVDGLLIGLLGSLTHQMLSFGFTATTLLWVLPAAVRGFIVGMYAKHKNFRVNRAGLVGIVISTGLLVTAMNTASIFIDSKIYGYYSVAVVFGTLIPRIVSSILTSLIYVVLVPEIMRYLKKIPISKK